MAEQGIGDQIAFAAFLPVDPLLALSRQQWGSEVFRVHQTLLAERDQEIAQLRDAVQAHLPAQAE